MNYPPQGQVSVSEILAYIREDRYFSLSETVAYLNLSERTIRERLAEMPHYRVGAKLLFRKSELDKWMLNHREKPEDLDIGKIVDDVVESILGKKK